MISKGCVTKQLAILAVILDSIDIEAI